MLIQTIVHVTGSCLNLRSLGQNYQELQSPVDVVVPVAALVEVEVHQEGVEGSPLAGDGVGHEGASHRGEAEAVVVGGVASVGVDVGEAAAIHIDFYPRSL